MTSVEVLVNNPAGLHARPASELAKLAKSFASHVIIEFNGKKLIAKSVLSIISGCIESGSLIKVSAEGVDEERCVQEIERFVKELDE
ncbi:MAG: HPr family phosphocarrier protein [Halanaerobiales bacterium]|nr:HPr family phosphocarrier protein [Halanaerobiales bacterium]